MTEWDEAERRVEKAHELFERGRWQEALNELKAAIDINPYNGSWFFNLGLTYDAMDRIPEAIKAYRQALEMDPEDAELLIALGHDCNRTGQFADAIECFEKVESLDPAAERCYCERIISYGELGDHENAEEMFFLARQYKEKCPACFYSMGNSLFARGRFDRALWCWQQVLEIDPDHPQVHARIGDAHWAKGHLAEARQHFIEELRSNPGDLDVMLDLGELLMEMGDLAPAAEKFRQILELSPDECTAMYHLGELAMKDGKPADALAFFRRVLHIDRAFPGAHLRMALIYAGRRERSEAIFHANCELAQQTNDEQILLDLGTLFLDLDQRGPAEVTFHRILSFHAESVPALHSLSVTLLQSGRTEEGIELARRTLKVQPKYMLAMHNLAVAYLAKMDLPRARYWLREALDIAPDDGQLRSLNVRLRLAAFTAAARALPRKVLGRK